MDNIILIAQTALDDQSDGVWNKVQSQFEALCSISKNVDLVCYAGKSIVMRRYKDGSIQDFSLKNNSLIPRKIVLWNTIFNVLKKNKYEYAYIRYPVIDFEVLKALKKMHSNGTRIVMEIPTYPFEGQHAKGALKLAYMVDSICHDTCSRYIEKIVYIGNKTDTIFGCKAQQIPNGIPVSLTSEKITGFRVSNGHVKLIAVSTMRIWHGYERLIKGLAEYYRSGNCPAVVDLVLIGDGPYKEEYKKIARDNAIEDHVIFTGKLSGKKLQDEYEDATVGIGSLGLYNNGMLIGSTLKTREYLLRGIPFVYGCEELGISKDYPYALLVPNDSSSININSILNFIYPLLEDSEKISLAMNTYAKEEFSWRKILCGVFNINSND